MVGGDEESILGERYALAEVLGVGGMAEVRRATDEADHGRDVAVKLLREASVDDPDAARLRSEARVLADLHHPGIVRVLDTGVHDGRPFLVMELVARATLKDLCLRHGALSPARTARIGAQLAGALDHVHRAGVVHRDVKPSNVLVDDDDRVWLTDFGIARPVDDVAHQTRTGTTVGSPAYLAPEQVRAERTITGAADVYALGLLLLECLSGRRCYPGPAVEAALARLTRPPEIPGHLGTSWVDLLRTMTAIDPATRPSALEVAARLRRLEAHETRTAPPSELSTTVDWDELVAEATSDDMVIPVPRTRARRRGRRLAAAAALAVGIGLAGSVGAMTAFGEDEPGNPVLPDAGPSQSEVAPVTPVAGTASPTAQATTAAPVATTAPSATTESVVAEEDVTPVSPVTSVDSSPGADAGRGSNGAANGAGRGNATDSGPAGGASGNGPGTSNGNGGGPGSGGGAGNANRP